ncbi:hypothetical protein [Companilactobacillus kimchiensis]|uniref:Uncharacterized protein n=1 Tax=Companilactobacillus kimchiensis TaxID=993692 RepID=A0A0R2L7H3_9LACO|nr:hypothetical protein [Companilactobacillus kimchiensis]KRN97710.1 hypothetical protein IV57_GL001634 [Companilactobacillus kimchiensis]
MHLSTTEKRNYLIGFIFIIFMVATATLLHDMEIILPEIGALTAGTWIYQNGGWINQPVKIFLAPSGTAIIGFLINQLTIGYAEKVLLGLLLMLILLRILHSNLAPSFATGLLPIIINATHWSFIVAILLFTLMLMCGVFIQGSYKQTSPSTPIQNRHMLIFTLMAIIWVGSVWFFGFSQMAAIPPVMVVFFEVLQKPNYHWKMATKHFIALVGAATIGVLVHLLFTSWLLSTAISLPLVFVLLQILKINLPAAFAFPLLALVLPTSMFHMLPITAIIATTFFLGSMVVLKKIKLSYQIESNKS